jgi:hypothetical protein
LQIELAEELQIRQVSLATVLIDEVERFVARGGDDSPRRGLITTAAGQLGAAAGALCPPPGRCTVAAARAMIR